MNPDWVEIIVWAMLIDTKQDRALIKQVPADERWAIALAITADIVGGEHLCNEDLQTFLRKVWDTVTGSNPDTANRPPLRFPAGTWVSYGRTDEMLRALFTEDENTYVDLMTRYATRPPRDYDPYLRAVFRLLLQHRCPTGADAEISKYLAQADARLDLSGPGFEVAQLRALMARTL